MDRHHHHGWNEEKQYPPQVRPSPPPAHTHHSGPHPSPPPPVVGHHSAHTGPNPPSFSAHLGPPPPVVGHHTTHTGPHPPSFSTHPGPPPPVVGHHSAHTGPHPPSFSAHPGPSPPVVGHHSTHTGPHPPSFSAHPGPAPPVVGHHSGPTVKMFCKGGTEFCLAIRDGKVIVARSNPSDPYQHWIKDETFGTRVKDEEGFPSFALVNKATGQAMKHATSASHPVQLTHHNPNSLNESILWTESKDTGANYRAIRMVNNIKLNVDVFHGDKNHGGVRDGSQIYLWEWTKGDNQRWKIVPY